MKGHIRKLGSIVLAVALALTFSVCGTKHVDIPKVAEYYDIEFHRDGRDAAF